MGWKWGFMWGGFGVAAGSSMGWPWGSYGELRGAAMGQQWGVRMRAGLRKESPPPVHPPGELNQAVGIRAAETFIAQNPPTPLCWGQSLSGEGGKCHLWVLGGGRHCHSWGV